MPNRQLTDEERKNLFEPLITEVRTRLRDICNNDEELLWALRRKLAKELGYDERSKPMHRKILKLKKWRRKKAYVLLAERIFPKGTLSLIALKP